MAWSTTVWGRVALAACGWLGRYWKWLVGALALAGAFLLGLLAKKSTPAADPIKDIRKEVEATAAKQVEQIQQIAAEREKAVVAHASEERTAGAEAVKQDTAAVKDDLTRTGEYLLGVGDEMRKP